LITPPDCYKTPEKLPVEKTPGEKLQTISEYNARQDEVEREFKLRMAGICTF
jgi:hypothetical protein